MCAEEPTIAEVADRPEGFFLVCIGASAGGVEALEKLFTEMPEDLGMAYVVVQHLSEEFESLMPQILSRRTDMEVCTISSGMKAEPNKVYVLQGGKLASMEQGVFQVEKNVNRRHNPIDHFFSSVAEDFQENSVGVVLSGTGSDGSQGIRDIHRQGGFVIVQSETSAKFNGMPRSAIATGTADAIICVDDIPDALARFNDSLICDGKTRRSLFVEAMGAEKRIQHLLHQRFGIDFEQYKSGMFGRR